MRKNHGIEVVWAGALVLFAACSRPIEEPLPEPVGISWPTAPEPCLVPPIWKEGRKLIRRPTDPGRCLTASFEKIMAQNSSETSRQTLPVQLRLSSDGRVVAIEDFGEWCHLLHYEVDRATSACILQSLRQWRFTPDDEVGCPHTFYKPWPVSIELHPPRSGCRPNLKGSGC